MKRCRPASRGSVRDYPALRSVAVAVDVTLSLPNEIARYLQRQPDPSVVVAEAVQAHMEEERARRHAEAAGYAEYVERNGLGALLDELATASNEISLREAGQP